MGCTKFTKFCTKFLNAIPSAFILCIVFWSYFAYVVALCFNIIENQAEKAIFLIIYHVLLLLFISNYLKAVFEKPLCPSDKYKISTEDFNRLIHEQTRDKIMTDIFQERNLKILTRNNNNSINICNKCYFLKPDRTHHCSSCGQCVLKMDHHCPWVSNCVGYHNYKFFVIFLFWGSLYCLFIFGTTIKPFISFWTFQRPTIHWPEFQILFLFIASIMFGLSQLILFFYHLKLILYNQTTLESFRPVHVTNAGDCEDAFNLGFMENLKEVLGDKIILWGMPIFTSRGNGHEFPMKKCDNLEESLVENPKLSKSENEVLIIES